MVELEATVGLVDKPGCVRRTLDDLEMATRLVSGTRTKSELASVER